MKRHPHLRLTSQEIRDVSRRGAHVPNWNVSSRAMNVTDHALVRWLERRYGLDLAVERRKIREMCRIGIGETAKSVRRDGLRFVIQDSTVITVITD